MLLHLIAAAWAGCAPMELSLLESSLDEAEHAFVAMELEDFSLARNEAIRAVGCLQAPLTPEAAARVHRLAGLAAFVAEDEAAALRAFAAAQALDPGHPLSAEAAPEGSPLRALWEATVAPPSGLGRTLPGVWVDGIQTDLLPTARPVVLQRWDAKGRPEGGAWLDVGDEIEGFSTPRRSTTGPAFLVGAGVCLAIAGGMVAAGLATEDNDIFLPVGAAFAGTAVGLGVGGGLAWAF